MSTFISVLGLSVGAISAFFFAVGALFVSTKSLYEITSGKWEVERHVWGDSIAEQRADYIAGALLLLLLFGLQLAAPSCDQSLPFQPLYYAIPEIVAVLVLVLGCSIFLRNAGSNYFCQMERPAHRNKPTEIPASSILA